MYQPCATRLTNRRADECERYAGASRWMRPKVNSAIDSQAPNGSSHASPRALLETPCKECNCTNSSSTGTFYEHNNQHPLSIICSLPVHQERVQSMAQCTMAQALKEFGIKDFVPLPSALNVVVTQCFLGFLGNPRQCEHANGTSWPGGKIGNQCMWHQFNY